MDIRAFGLLLKVEFVSLSVQVHALELCLTQVDFLFVQQGVVFQTEQVLGQTPALFLQPIPLQLQGAEIHGPQLFNDLLALIQPDRAIIAHPRQGLLLRLELFAELLQTQTPHRFQQRGKLRAPAHDAPVVLRLGQFKQDVPPTPPVQATTEPIHICQHPKQVLVYQIVHRVLKLVFLDRDPIDIKI